MPDLKAIIIDDEQNAGEGLKHLINLYVDDVKVCGVANSAKQGIELIKKHSPDLVFLDVEMPGGSGFNMLEQMKTIDFQIIITTGYDHYAIKAIKYSALDYLVKPIDIDELVKAVSKARKKSGIPQPESESKEQPVSYELTRSKRIALPTIKGLCMVRSCDIISVEADGNCACISMANGNRMLITKSIGEISEMLDEAPFFRAHRSHIINLDYVREYLKGKGGTVLMSDGSSIHVSPLRKEAFC